MAEKSQRMTRANKRAEETRAPVPWEELEAEPLERVRNTIDKPQRVEVPKEVGDEDQEREGEVQGEDGRGEEEGAE